MPIDQIAKLSRENGDYSASKAYIGIFLKAPDEAPYVPDHVGLIYVGAKNETRVLHYVTTNLLLDDLLIKPGSSTLKPYFHAPLPLEEDDLIAVCGILAVSNKEWHIRYSMNWTDGVGAFAPAKDKEVKDKDAKQVVYGFPSEEGGLTCATFVAELLAGLGHRPVACDSWEPNREADVAWREKRLTEYEKAQNTRITPERIAQMRSEDPFYRLRPEEVTAASLHPPSEKWPVNYDVVKGLAADVLSRFAEEAKRK